LVIPWIGGSIHIVLRGQNTKKVLSEKDKFILIFPLRHYWFWRFSVSVLLFASYFRWHSLFWSWIALLIGVIMPPSIDIFSGLCEVMFVLFHCTFK
jgi:hypothetical protein